MYATRRSQDGLSFHARQGHEAHPSSGGAGRLGELLWLGDGWASTRAGNPLVPLLQFPACEFRTFWGNFKKKKKKREKEKKRLLCCSGWGVCGGRGQQPRGWDPMGTAVSCQLRALSIFRCSPSLNPPHFPGRGCLGILRTASSCAGDIPGLGWDLKGSEEGSLLLANRFWLGCGASPGGAREGRQTRGLERRLRQAGVCPFPAPDGALAGSLGHIPRPSSGGRRQWPPPRGCPLRAPSLCPARTWRGGRLHSPSGGC
ncbi:uncharacterized protein LOC120498060 isoform X2 [Passer montanus]|uniref:uncharacterized protein LOC120498060 isoform X2 n=1 Tax=Passer montanus TaxID=9160 RepID=UPI0019610FC3|nr:uncharacterized protein LOC120498060 isoform X2 [Passer montanus]